jgi:hypothetical protein
MLTNHPLNQENPLENNLSFKIEIRDWQTGLSSKSTCLASVRPQVQTPVPLKKKLK